MKLLLNLFKAVIECNKDNKMRNVKMKILETFLL